MPACPNCGRPTLRTKDWACQWCGYPLLSRAYKKIDKTFKELQEEKFSGLKTSPAEPEAASYAKTVSELRTAPEPPPPAPKPPLPSEQKPQPAPKPPPPAQQQPPPVPKSPPPAEQKPEPAPKPPPPSKQKPQPPPAPAPAAEVPLQPETELESGPEPPPELTTEPEPPPLPVPEAEPPAPPVIAPDLNAVNDGAVLSVDELDALYKADRQAAHARLTGKTIVVKGLVEKVFIRDHIDVRYIMLTGASRKVAWTVRCTFERENISQMERLTEGQEVALRGKYDNYGKNIIFKDCSLV
jgi:hypothetical protein